MEGSSGDLEGLGGMVIEVFEERVGKWMILGRESVEKSWWEWRTWDLGKELCLEERWRVSCIV